MAQGYRICLPCRRCGVDSWVGKIPWRGKRQPAPIFLPGKCPRQRGLAGYSPWGCTEWDTTEHTHKVCSPTSVGLRVGCVNALPLGRIPLIQKDCPQYNSPHLCHLFPAPHYYLISAMHHMAFNCVSSPSFSNIYKSQASKWHMNTLSALGPQMVKNPPAMQETRVRSLGG